ncbi:glycerophosphodiester phosphodiesterase [Neobacillus niacini]|uniref:glycerophosphodiester phosphodiesterase n=1 Tax=Neobacillus niacini TaxID=86668 RepID=UPI0005EDE7A5|nr:glycerophosphodiester phosphodiesterase [Neobacillus niacini]
MEKTKIYGHRGSMGDFPENTLLSFQQAIEQGVEGLELDVHMTKDLEIVVIHDEMLDRTTDGTGYVKDLSLDDIKGFSAGVKFSHFRNYEESLWRLESVPTLKEVLELIWPYDIELNIELKTNIIPYEGIEEKVLSLVKKYGNDRKVIYSSFHLPTLIRIKRIDSSANIAWLLDQQITLAQDYIHSLELEGLHLSKDIVLMDNCNLKEISKNIRVWTVNDSKEINQLLDFGVNAIMTNFPEKALLIRNERK